VAQVLGLLTHNGQLKLAAAALAIFLWALVETGPDTPGQIATVPVVVSVQDTSWTTSGFPDPSEVEVEFSSPAGEVVRMPRDVRIRVPIRLVSSPDSDVVLRREWVDFGSGRRLDVERIIPASVRISFEEAVTRVVPFSLSTQGALPTHLAFAGALGVNPQVARVRGASRLVEGLDNLPLVPIDLSRVRASGIVTTAVDVRGLPGVEVSPGVVTVGVRVEEAMERLLPGIEVVPLSDGGTGVLRVDPAVVDVRLRGARTVVTALDPGALQVWIPQDLVTGMSPGEERRVRVQVEGVPELASWQATPETVVVRRPRSGRE